MRLGILNRYAIAATVSEVEYGIILVVHNIYSAQTLLKAFRRYRVQVLAVDASEYKLFVPIQPDKLLVGEN